MVSPGDQFSISEILEQDSTVLCVDWCSGLFAVGLEDGSICIYDTNDIFGKKEEDSIALTMLSKGVLAMIGSTTISYGSVTTPLIGADLFG